MDCFSRPFLVTVMNTDVFLRTLYAKLEDNAPVNLFLRSRAASAEVTNTDVLDFTVVSKAHSSTTNPLTATALIYALGAGITAGAGTRLVLQLLLDIGWL